jgi:hypothetical protein
VGQGWPTGDLVMPVKKDHLRRCTSQKLFKWGRAEFMSVCRTSLSDRVLLKRYGFKFTHCVYLRSSIILGSMSLYRVVQKSLGTRGNVLLGLPRYVTYICRLSALLPLAHCRSLSSLNG